METTAAKHSSRIPGELLAGLGVLVALVALVYWPAIAGEFVWDDRANLLEHEHARAFTIENLRWAVTHSHAGHYQPLTWVSFMLDHAIGGLDPWIYHATSIAWHALDTVLFALVAWHLLRAASGSLGATPTRAHSIGAIVAAAVFSLHPLRVESVAWITERRDVLSSAFFLFALLAYLCAARLATKRLHVGWYCAALGLFAVSMLCKALAMATPVVLLVIDVYPLRRHISAGWRKLVAEKLPFLFVALAGAWIALQAQSSAGALVDTGIHGWIGRITTVFYGIAFYPRAMLAAKDWYPLYEVTRAVQPSEPRFALSIVFVIAATVALFALRRRYPALLAAWVAYIALLGPVSGIAQSGIHLVADRYSYLSCLGFALLLGYGVAGWSQRTRPNPTCAIVTAVVLTYWGVRSWQQTHVWRDERSLWTHVLEQGPSTVAYDNLGADANRRGDRAGALDNFARALEILPQNDYARNDMVAILTAGDPRAGRDVLEKSADALGSSLAVHRSEDARAWYALGLVRASLRQREKAAAAFERALVLDPDNARARASLERLRSGG